MLGVVAVISLAKLYKQSGQKISLYRHPLTRSSENVDSFGKKALEMLLLFTECLLFWNNFINL